VMVVAVLSVEAEERAVVEAVVAEQMVSLE
jgi:hypothetical protein